MVPVESTPLISRDPEPEEKAEAPAIRPLPLIKPPEATFVSALRVLAPPTPTHGSASSNPRTLPQTIAHRGDKAAYPENTMSAFRAAADAGAHAIETDLHLSRDGVVVLSHDGTLRRCFGDGDSSDGKSKDRRISDYDWEYLRKLRTLREPKDGMPRLLDLLVWLAEPPQRHIWLLLDIKTDDPTDELVRRTRQTIESVSVGEGGRSWKDRIVLGCWNAKCVAICSRLAPAFPLAYIGFSTSYAQQFLDVPNMGFNIFQKMLVGPFGVLFLRRARAAGRPVFAWTVDDERWMEWCIRNGLDGVITDNPARFLEVCRRHGGSATVPPAVVPQPLPPTAEKAPPGRTEVTRPLRAVQLYLELFGIHIIVVFFSAFFFVRHGLGKSRFRKDIAHGQVL